MPDGEGSVLSGAALPSAIRTAPLAPGVDHCRERVSLEDNARNAGRPYVLVIRRWRSPVDDSHCVAADPRPRRATWEIESKWVNAVVLRGGGNKVIHCAEQGWSESRHHVRVRNPDWLSMKSRGQKRCAHNQEASVEAH
jgi:hypothetical protein